MLTALGMPVQQSKTTMRAACVEMLVFFGKNVSSLVLRALSFSLYAGMIPRNLQYVHWVIFWSYYSSTNFWTTICELIYYLKKLTHKNMNLSINIWFYDTFYIHITHVRCSESFFWQVMRGCVAYINNWWSEVKSKRKKTLIFGIQSQW